MDLPTHYPQVTLEAFVVMPNHMHGIVVINDLSRGGSETHPYKIWILDRSKSPLVSTNGFEFHKTRYAGFRLIAGGDRPTVGMSGNK